ncbi:MAG: ABA4-like family protein [Pseudomonadota bacterium]
MAGLSADTLFLAANAVALWGWIALLASPWIPTWSDRIAAVVIPLLLALAYTILAVQYLVGGLATGDGGYFTLDAVQALFNSKEVILIGWLHVLAFDLFVGAWIVRTARTERVPFWIVIVCLVPTFLFGPAGFLAFHVLRSARSFRAA